eukprot:g1162.t1
MPRPGAEPEAPAEGTKDKGEASTPITLQRRAKKLEDGALGGPDLFYFDLNAAEVWTLSRLTSGSSRAAAPSLAPRDAAEANKMDQASGAACRFWSGGKCLGLETDRAWYTREHQAAEAVTQEDNSPGGAPSSTEVITVEDDDRRSCAICWDPLTHAGPGTYCGAPMALAAPRGCSMLSHTPLALRAALEGLSGAAGKKKSRRKRAASCRTRLCGDCPRLACAAVATGSTAPSPPPARSRNPRDSAPAGFVCDDGPRGTTPRTLWGMKCLAMYLLRSSLPCQCWTSERLAYMQTLAAILRHGAPGWQKIRNKNKASRFERDKGAPRRSGSLNLKHWMGPTRYRLQMSGPLLVLDPQERPKEGNERRKTKARAARGLSKKGTPYRHDHAAQTVGS